MFNNQQTGDEIYEDQLLNSLVNSLDEEIALSLVEDTELDAENIYEVPVDACTDGTSVSALYKRGENTPYESSVLCHLHTGFDLETFEQIRNAPLQEDVLDVLPQQIEVYADLCLQPYCGDGDDTDDLYRS